MTFQEFANANRVRCESPRGFNHTLDSWSMSDWLTAVAGELGEAANVVKKLNRVRDGIPGNDKTPDELKDMLRDEVADTFIYLDLFAQACGFRLHDAVVDKFNRTSAKIGFGGTIGY
jgi:NTP pyrophosphatase (non-canonical NTP hydrolase)